MIEGLVGSHPGVAAVAALYAVALLVSAPAALARRRGAVLAGFALFSVAFLANTVVILLRWAEAGRPPFKTLFETMVFYPWCVALVTLILVGLHRLFVLVPFSSAVSLAGLGYALYRPDVELVNLPPALQSGWFVPHVVTYFVAYAGLFASFVLAGLALVRKKGEPAPEAAPGMEDHAHRAAIFGVTALTLGLVMGAAWGKFAWGDYWSWDPKENWALVTWLAYVAYLHLRIVPGWKGARSMWLLVVSFGAVVFTYLGMNLLPAAGKSLHVYQ